MPPKQQKPLKSAAQRRQRPLPPTRPAQPTPTAASVANVPSANAQRRQRTQRRHCYPPPPIQLQGNSCDKRTDLHQKLAEAALSPRGARESS
jgi:hypothetical protein